MLREGGTAGGSEHLVSHWWSCLGEYMTCRQEHVPLGVGLGGVEPHPASCSFSQLQWTNIIGQLPTQRAHSQNIKGAKTTFLLQVTFDHGISLQHQKVTYIHSEYKELREQLRESAPPFHCSRTKLRFGHKSAHPLKLELLMFPPSPPEC